MDTKNAPHISRILFSTARRRSWATEIYMWGGLILWLVIGDYLQLRVEGFPYVGIGNSLKKKDAQTNAARDFARYLVREGYLKESEVPSISVC